jgi:hypothetical protein
MSVYYAEYALQDGFIDNWLVAGPQAIEVPELERFQGQDLKPQITRHYYDPEPGITDMPVESDEITVGDADLRWRYSRCPDDHFVDLTAFYHTPHYLRAWAYAQLVSPSTQQVTFVLTTNGPGDVWLNGQHAHRQEHFHHQIPHSAIFSATLEEGPNNILVRVEAVATRECPYAMALQLRDVPADDGGEGLTVLLPTPNKDIPRRRRLEAVFDAAYVEQDVYVFDDEIVLRWPEDLAESASVAVRLQTPTNRIFAEALRMGKADNYAKLGHPYQHLEGPYQAVVMPRPREYYEGKMRVRRKIPLYAMRNKYSDVPYSTYTERRIEALEDAARRQSGVYSEIAKMAIGRWHWVRNDMMMEAIEGINQRRDCSDFYLVGLLGAMYRYWGDPSFPETLKKPLEECVLNFRYWMDEPGSDAMCFWSENHQILFHACEVLAGQLYADRTFTNTGKTGQWHREKGERMALSWLKKRGTGGFREWDSNCYFEEDLLAMVYLADLAQTPQVYEMAAVVMDKMFFSMALNSFRGVFGSTHGRTYSQLIKGGRVESTSGIGRLMWGMGAYNSHIRGRVALACADQYQLPPMIGSIAAELPQEMWSRERHAGVMEEWCDLDTGPWEVNKVTYKAPDYMLASAQDYHPGEAGVQQHIWQATLGTDAVVFVTHPPCVSEEGSHRPNFWHGNVILPRVAQWKDVLIAVHKLPEDDWLGFTHAYFPTWAFDEHALRKNAEGHTWAFARKNEGYLALTASLGLDFIERGDSAYRELRSYGKHNVWLCHMGRAAQDGSFEAFQNNVLTLEFKFQGLSAHFPTLRGETLAFGWQGPLTRDGAEEAIGGFKHYDNAYCVAGLPAETMDIRYKDELLRLDFKL